MNFVEHIRRKLGHFSVVSLNMAAVSMPKRGTAGVTDAALKRRRNSHPTDPLLVVVMDTLEAIDAIGASKDMLKAGCPGSLGVPSNERHELQQMTVGLVENVLSEQLQSLQKVVEDLNGKIAQMEAKKTELSSVAEDKKLVLAARTAELDGLRSDLVAMDEAVATAEQAVQASLDMQNESERKSQALKDEKKRVESAITDHLQPVQAEDLEISQCIEHGKVLTDLAKQLNLDESLTASVPKTCAVSKAERGSFGELVLNSLAELLNGHVASLDAKIAEGAPSLSMCEANVVQAVQAMEAATKDQKEKIALIESAAAAQAKHDEEFQKADVEMLTQDVEVDKLIHQREVARREVDNFQEGPLHAFTQLKNKDSCAVAAGA